MLGIDAKIEDLQTALISVINEFNMPATILEFVLSDLLNNVKFQKAQQIQMQREAYALEQSKAQQPEHEEN